MSEKNTTVEYQTIQVGTALLAHALLKELRVANAIDAAINYQPEINATYGHLLQVVILNRLTFAPQPLYCMSEWAAVQRCATIRNLSNSAPIEGRPHTAAISRATGSLSGWCSQGYSTQVCQKDRAMTRLRVCGTKRPRCENVDAPNC